MELVQEHYVNLKCIEVLVPFPLVSATVSAMLSIALLIDCENVAAKYAREIVAVAGIFGDCATRKLYANFNLPHFDRWKSEAANLCLDVVPTPRIVQGKNSSDISLAVGAMDLAHSGKYDGYVIVSSDSDFTALVQRLRNGGRKFVAGIGARQTHSSLRDACDMFIELGNLRGTANELKRARSALRILRNALKSTSTKDSRWTHIAVVRDYIREQAPGFSAQTYGCAGLQELVEKLPEFEVGFVNSYPGMRIRNNK